MFLTPRTQQTIIDPIVPGLPPIRGACTTHPWDPQYCCGSSCLSEPAIRISPATIFFYHTFLRTKPRLAYRCHLHLPSWCFFCVVLCVIRQCHRSSCARHSAPTTEAGSILCACGRCARHFSTTAVKFVVVIGIGLCTYLLMCVTSSSSSVPIIPGSFAFVESSTTNRPNRSYEHRVLQHSYINIYK